MATFNDNGIARVSSVLPAAGAYDSEPISVPLQNMSEVTFMCEYTRGGASGAVTFKLQFSNDKSNWYDVAELQSATLSAGVDVADLIQRANISYTATGATAELFMTPTFTTAGQWFRIVAKESGNVGAPGTLLVEYFLRGGI